nr:glycine cleavage system protein GcvH [bacterium]
MNMPENLLYTKSHEWLQRLEDGRVRVGMTDFAQSQMGDLVFINLPEVGDAVTMGERFADVESVKAVEDVFSPVSGTVCAVNEALLDAPESVNSDPYGAWLAEMNEISQEEELLDAQAYAALVASEEA